jgi:peptide/nickel transport system ATP-binding protein
MNPLLDVKNLHVTLTREGRIFSVSRHTNLSVKKGEILGLIGESGCGKTLTTLSLTGLLPEKSKICFDSYVFGGKTVRPDTLVQLRGKEIAFIFQEPGSHLNPLFSIGDQIRETFLRHTPGSKNYAETFMRQVLEDVGLKPAESYAGRFAHQLSGGISQRVMIALALSCRPRLLVADEPTTALDEATKRGIVDLVKKLATEKQLSVIWISHDISLMESFADRIHVMYAGCIVEEGAAQEVLETPLHPYTRGLLACLPSHARGKEFFTIPGEPPDLTDLPQGCAFCPRCPFVLERCRKFDPEFFPKTTTQKARCFLLQKN